MTPRRVALVGPTATGKSAIAMAVALESGDVDIVSIDSMQVYRGMDIGTAKPSPSDQQQVRHHCIDLVEPTAEFTVADFRPAFGDAIQTVGRRGHRALLVGGTGLYHRVVIDGFDLPGEYPSVRAELELEPDTARLHHRLQTEDPAAASKIEPGNRRRIIRALEVTLGSGRRFSAFGPGLDAYPPSPVTQIGVRLPRRVIAARIETRVHEMVAAGLVDEVAAVAEQGMSRSAGQALGYKEIVAYLDGRIGKDEAIEMTITRTRQFAVRQERWFRRDPRVQWIDVEHHPVAEVAPAVIDALRS